jgi:FAD/FMN-containing dehydrogenase
MHSLAAAELSRLYPRWKDAPEVRREIDPDNRFVTPYMAQLLGLE